MKQLLIAILALVSTALFAAEKEDIYPQQSKETEQVASRYFAAYFNKHWDTVESLLAENASFADPTATQLFDGVELWKGKSEMMRNFREQYALSEFNFKKTREMFSGGYAIFEGTLLWSLKLPKRTIQSTVPLITVLKVDGGQVVEHRDYADYHDFIEAEKKSRPAK